MPKDPSGASRWGSYIHRAGGDGWRVIHRLCTCTTSSQKVQHGPCGVRGHKGRVIWLLGVLAIFHDLLHVIGRDFTMTAVEQPTAIWVPGPTLGVETSCDETAASVLATNGTVLSN